MAPPIGRSIAAVSIGVDRPGILDPLRAAASSAIEFHNWVLTQQQLGVEVDSTVLTDKDKEAVSHRDVTDAVRRIVNKRRCDTLFLYFSGHGVMAGGYDEKFLLSEVDKYPNETVNVHATRLDAKYCGISHVVVVYDACRSPADGRFSRLGGSSIIERKTKLGGHVDVFFACPPDESAYEIPLTKQAFFTDILLALLKEPPDGMVEPTTIRKRPVYVIPSHRLERFLKSEVPKRAAGTMPPFDQFPDIDTPSHLPEFFSVARFRYALEEEGGDENAIEAFPSGPPLSLINLKRLPPERVGSSEVVQWHAKRLFHGETLGTMPEDLREVERTNGFDRAIDAMNQAHGREGFDTHTGFTVIGAGIANVVLSGKNVFSVERGDRGPKVSDIRVGRPPWDVRGGTAVIELSEGGGIVLGIMPGYVGTVVVQDGVISALAYAPSEGSSLYESYKWEKEELQARRGLAAAAASVAKLHELARSEGLALAEHIRVMKGYDPSLGILAAYAYYINGDEENVRSVWQWMSETRVNSYSDNKPILAPVPFDVAMLAGKTKIKKGTVAPCCPMFSFGWSLLEQSKMRVPRRIREAGLYRRPGTWSAFDEPGIRRFREALEKGEIA